MTNAFRLPAHRKVVPTAPPRSAVPSVRRFPVGLALVASVGVFATSLSPMPAPWLGVLTAAWFAALAVGLVGPSRVAVPLLTVVASATKALTVVLVGWALTHGPGSVGPHTAVDWAFLGPLNAGTGLWLLAVIRHRAE